MKTPGMLSCCCRPCQEWTTSRFVRSCLVLILLVATTNPGGFFVCLVQADVERFHAILSDSGGVTWRELEMVAPGWIDLHNLTFHCGRDSNNDNNDADAACAPVHVLVAKMVRRERVYLFLVAS